MSWVILSGFLTVIVLFTVIPLFTTQEVEQNTELELIKDQLAAYAPLKSDTSSVRTAKQDAITALEARALEIIQTEKSDTVKHRSYMALAITMFICAGSAVTYSLIGSPGFEYAAAQFSEKPRSIAEDLPLDELTQRLSARLKNDPAPPPVGYQLLGRSLMELGRFTEALEAYETAISLSDGATEIRQEYLRAKAYIDELSQADAVTNAAEIIGQLPENEQSEMIKTMVDGLSLKLKENPEDMQAWQRLLRSRLVLQQEDLAREEILAGLAALGEQPLVQIELETLAVSMGIDLNQ